VGCGGDRDKAKRPVMAEIACKGSDLIILTSDNPRSEEPDAILEEMKVGIPFAKMRKTFSITDRKEAIKLACSMASVDDVILVAGKGHEKYQEIKGVKNHFDDKEILKEFI
jgi:UDP-N-acetylmuramoyl-L-alanyl-D-glutamate--2,6-diaminopimelate ligase